MKVVLGCAFIDAWSPADVPAYERVLSEHGITDFDTSPIYHDHACERCVAKLSISGEKHIHTKSPGYKRGVLTYDNVMAAGEKSLSCCGTIDAYFLQSPDPDVPIEQTLTAVQELYKRGTFSRFGLSNFPAEQVREIHNMCKKKGWILPTIFTGPYNAVCRGSEIDIIPTNRALGMSYWVYWPVAGGFLTKNYEDFNLPGSEGYGKGRFSKEFEFGFMLNAQYNKPDILVGLKVWNGISRKHDIEGGELAFRWLVNHSMLDESKGDAVMIGSSSPGQVKKAVERIGKGRLSDVEQIDRVWELVKDHAPDGAPEYW